MNPGAHSYVVFCGYSPGGTGAGVHYIDNKYSTPETIVAELPPGVIPVSADEFDRLYPQYQRQAKRGETFQQWFKAYRREAAAKRIRLVKTTAEYTK